MKLKLSTLLLFAILLLPLNSLAQDEVLHFPLDENAGSIAYDTSGYGNDGTIFGASWTNGRFGYALEFDGSNDYVNVPDTGASSLDVTTVTMEAWIRPKNYDVVSDRGIIINKENTWEMGLQDLTGRLQAAFSPCWRWAGTYVIPLDTWTHVAVVYNGTHQVHYAGGTFIESFSCPGSLAINNNDLRIAARGGDGSPSAYFNGTIDEVLVYPRALTEEEIASHALGPGGITLTPGETEFSTRSIFFPTGDINFTGNTTHLNTYWEAYYSDESADTLGAVCFLNCDERYNTTCPPPGNCSCDLVQNCSVLAPTGKWEGGCSILNPNYNSPYNTSNFVSCRFYDPVYPSTRGHIYRSLTPIEFSVWLTKFSSIVGEEFNFPIHVKNSGLFYDRFNISIYTSPSIYMRPELKDFITPQFHGDVFDPHVWQQSGPDVRSFNIKMTILDASSDSTVCINVTSELMKEKGIALSRPLPPNDCIKIKSEMKVMPELSLSSLLILALIASIFIFKFKTRF